MLKLYHNPISPHSRRVWVAILEKGLEAELVEIELNGIPNRPELLAINPFHHIPVLEDDDFKIVESFAILDYLEAKYPTPSLLPNDARSLAKVRMVQMLTITELLPATMPAFPAMFGLPVEPEIMEQVNHKLSTVITFFEQLLSENEYFAGSQLTFAEVTAGTVIPMLHFVGFSLNNHPKISAWLEKLNQRPSWINSLPTSSAMEAFMSQTKTRLTTAS